MTARKAATQSGLQLQPLHNATHNTPPRVQPRVSAMNCGDACVGPLPQTGSAGSCLDRGCRSCCRSRKGVVIVRRWLRELVGSLGLSDDVRGCGLIRIEWPGQQFLGVVVVDLDPISALQEESHALIGGSAGRVKLEVRQVVAPTAIDQAVGVAGSPLLASTTNRRPAPGQGVSIIVVLGVFMVARWFRSSAVHEARKARHQDRCRRAPQGGRLGFRRYRRRSTPSTPACWATLRLPAAIGPVS